MAEIDIDFNGAAQPTGQTNTDVNAANQEDTTNLHGNETADVNETKNEDDVEGKDDETTSSIGGLEPGTNVEFDGVNYVVAENGDIVDEEGNVFKAAKDVEQWLKENSTEEETPSDFTIANLQDAIGLDITDENGDVVEFENTPAGMAEYIDAVLDTKTADLQDAAINRFFMENPIVGQFMDYLQLNNGDPRGFGEIPDRSGIKLDPKNEGQLEAVIRMAAHEFGNASLNDSYIDYLKSTGDLYKEATTQLNALVEKDNAYMKQLNEQANLLRQQEEEEVKQYWNNVYNAIAKRTISGYRIPESIMKEIDGQKITLTPDDFYDYLSRTTESDEDGNPMTGYQRDLNSLSDEELLDRELLDAWLMFTGGSYKDLINMAVKENEAKKLVVKSKQQKSTKTIKVTKQNKKANIDDILF